MDRKEVAELLTKVDLLYPGKIKEAQKKNMLDTWSWALEDIDKKRANDNLKIYSLENEYPPTVSDIAKGTQTNTHRKRGHQPFVLDLNRGEE